VKGDAHLHDVCDSGVGVIELFGCLEAKLILLHKKCKDLAKVVKLLVGLGVRHHEVGGMKQAPV